MAYEPFVETPPPVDPEELVPVEDYQAPTAPGLLQIPTTPINQPREITAKETTSGQLQQLTASDSPYIQEARQRGKEYASSRGLLSSSIGAGASQREAIKAAAPIAQADAAVYSQSAISAQEANQQQALTSHQGQLQHQIETSKAGYVGQINAEQERYKQEAGLRTEQFTQDAEFRNTEQKINAEMARHYDEIGLDQQVAYTETSGKMLQQYWQEYAKIATSQMGVLNKGNSINDLTTTFRDGMNLIAAQHSVEITWEDFEQSWID